MTAREIEILRERVQAVGRKRVSATMDRSYDWLSRILGEFDRLTPARKAEIEAALAKLEVPTV